MRKLLIRMLGGYTEPGLMTVKPTEMTSSTVNRNFTNITVEVKIAQMEIKVSAWDDTQAMKLLNEVLSNLSPIPETSNPLAG